MVERQIAHDAVPPASERDGELLGDIERSVRVNGEERVEVPDADGAPLGAGSVAEHERERAGEKECAMARPHDGTEEGNRVEG